VHQLYDWFGANVALFHLINSLHTVWWDRVMLGMTWLGDHERYPYYMAMVLMVAYLRPHWLQARSVAVFGIAYACTAVAVLVLKPQVNFPRPLLVLGKEVILVGRPEYHHSFPSGHATFSVLLAAALSPGVGQQAKWALWAFAALVCVSRVSLGVHFPADVLAGASLALVTVWAVSLALQRIDNRLRDNRQQTTDHKPWTPDDKPTVHARDV
jgi:membrane-associated phospholipid phosphatase